jgi:Mrp family chromosome partitioning ATPase/capsular polysaccharide biosynthesis protein
MNQTTEAPAIFAPLWRRKWLILAVAVLVAAGTYFYYKRQRPVYQSTTQVYLGAGAEEQAAGGASKKSLAVNSGNQTTLINSLVVPEVRRRLRRAANQAAARGKVKAKGAEKSQFITITAEAHKARAAALLVNEVARVYIKRQRATHERAIQAQIAIARRQLRRIEIASIRVPSKAGGKASAPAGSGTASVLQQATLNGKINQLETQLSSAGAQQVNPAKPLGARQVAPKPRQNAIFGFVIGLVLASVAAYLLGRLDRRLRTLEGVETIFGAQILTPLPKVGAPVVHRDGDPRPSQRLIEPLRRLHAALKFGGTLQRDGHTPPCTVLILSPDAGDGKSTLVADLAMVQRDAGERVAVVDANLRRPVQAKLLNVSAAYGVGDVVAGRVPIEAAMQAVRPSPRGFDMGPGNGRGAVATMVEEQGMGSLSLLAGGDAPQPPAILAHEAMSDLLRSLAVDHDHVLIDASAPLEVSDVMPLLGQVDGIVVVARIGHTREGSAQRLAQLLAHTPSAPLLGVVANCAAERDIERYGFVTSPNGWPWRRKPLGA